MAIPGGNQPPYRAPCEGTALCGNGPRFQGAKASEKNIPVWLYDATVPNWDGCPGQPANIPPYERPNATYTDPATDDCGGGDTTYTQTGGPWMGICQNSLLEDVACSGSTTPAAGSAQEVFDLANTPPVSWYQPQMLTAITISNGGSGYEVGDLLDLNGGTQSTYISPPGGIPSNTAYIAVATIGESGNILTAIIPNSGSYKTIPSSPNAVMGGHGTGASIGLTFANQTESLAQCKKIGYKNVQAKRQWHGTPGFYFDAPTEAYYCPIEGDCVSGTYCNPAPYQSYSNTASQTKYGSVSYNITVDYNVACVPSSSYTDTYEASLSVNPQSGVVTVNSGSFGCGTASGYAGLMGTTPAGWIGIIYNPPSPGFAFPGCGVSEGDTMVMSCDESSYTWTISDGSGDETTVSASWTITATSFDYNYSHSITGEDACGGGLITYDTVAITLSITDSSMSYSNVAYLDPSYCENCGEPYASVYITASFSNGISAGSILSDIDTLLGEWDMTDDALYPWRTDGDTSVAPMVSRNEVPGNVSPLEFVPFAVACTPCAESGCPNDCDTSCAGCPEGYGCVYTEDCYGNAVCSEDWAITYSYNLATDPNALLYDDSILGAPKPAGYQGFFDFRWEDWQIVGTIGGLPDYEIVGWGSGSPGNFGVPLNATQWTNLQEAIQFPGGAWIFYNLNPSVAANGDCFNPGANCPSPAAILIAQKWAETKVPFPSQNFFRPAGNDRFVYDEENVYAIGSTSGGPGPGTQINLLDTVHCDATTSVVATGLWGPYPDTDGNLYFWSVTGGGASVTLDLPIYLCPDTWASTSRDGQASSPSTLYCFGKLRWSTGNPSTDPFPILGRGGVTSVAEYMGSSSVSELTASALPNMGMILTTVGYDEIDIYDKFMNLLSSAAQVTRIDDSHFTVPVGLTTIQNAAWIMSHGAPNYKWDDQFPKGDYVYTDWTYWPRQSYEPTRINTVYAACAGELCGTDPSTGCDCSAITCETPAGSVFSGFTQTPGCVAFNPCTPGVLCISPNGESFQNGATYGFASINLDEEYGSGWQAEFQQVMTDLLWQVPHVPATNPCATETTTWIEDDGTCEPDGTGGANCANMDGCVYFPHRPLVEARTSVPSGAPSLPSGITIGWVSPVTDPTSPDALYPSNSNVGGINVNAPWVIWENECGCIQGSGRFDDIYENQVVTCD